MLATFPALRHSLNRAFGALAALRPLVRWQGGLSLRFFSAATAIFAAAMLSPMVRHASAQDPDVQIVWVDYDINWAVYDPYSAVTSRIYAQAALIRAQADASVGFATARVLNAEAYDRELDNWAKQVRVYWERKAIAEKSKLELREIKQIKKILYLNDQKWRNNRTWNRLKNHPELSRTSIENGNALNFLLDRLSVSVLPYRFDEESSLFSGAALEQLSLDESWLADIHLKQGKFTFPANHDVGESISLWPYLLRWDEFETERTAFEKARQSALQEAQKHDHVAVATIRSMQSQLAALTKKFHSSQPVKDWVRQHRRYRAFETSDHFLKRLDQQLAQLEETGDIRPFRGRHRFDPATDGKHVVAFLTYLNRNGIEFAPPRPGNEYAYHNMFAIMRAIYLTVAENDESLQFDRYSNNAANASGESPGK